MWSPICIYVYIDYIIYIYMCVIYVCMCVYTYKNIHHVWCYMRIHGNHPELPAQHPASQPWRASEWICWNPSPRVSPRNALPTSGARPPGHPKRDPISHPCLPLNTVSKKQGCPKNGDKWFLLARRGEGGLAFVVLLGSSKVKDKPPSSSTVSCAQAAHFTRKNHPTQKGTSWGWIGPFCPQGPGSRAPGVRGIFLSQSTVATCRYQNSLIRPTKSAKNKQNLKHIWEVISHSAMLKYARYGIGPAKEGSARPASGRFSHDMPRKITGELTAVIHVNHVSKQA